MKFRVEHTFTNITLQEYEQLYFTEEFNLAMCTAVKLARTLVERTVTDNHIHRIVTVGPDREIPPAAARILGAKKIEYTEHLDYDFGSYKGTWKTISSLLTDKVDTRGTFAFTERDGKVVRVVDGVIKVNIFGVGVVVEKFIVADIVKSYERVAEFTQRWIDGDGKL